MQKRLRLSKSSVIIAGVCGGIAEYFEVDATLIRVIYVIVLIGSFGLSVLIYAILILLMRNN